MPLYIIDLSNDVICNIATYADNFNAGKTQLDSFDRSNNTSAIDVKMDGSVLEEKSSFKILGLSFSSILGWGRYIISIAKTFSQNIGALIYSINFLSPGVALYLYISILVLRLLLL